MKNIPEPIKALVRLLAEVAVKEYLESQKEPEKISGKPLLEQKKRA